MINIKFKIYIFQFHKPDERQTVLVAESLIHQKQCDLPLPTP